MKSKPWIQAQDDYYRYALKLADLKSDEAESIKVGAPGQAILMGLVIMADWIASNEDLFPLKKESEYSDHELAERIEQGWLRFRAPARWNFKHSADLSSLYESRFQFSPRPFQKSAVEVASQTDAAGIFIVEAPMGEGKTEAALEMAETVARRFGLTGLFFALPTQATADSIFLRIKSWMSSVGLDEEGAASIYLAHSRSMFNSSYTEIPRGTVNSKDACIVHEWFTGRKKGILSDFVVGTVDQVLMLGLKKRHLALRHLGFANKVVVIDEVHAYDQYMGSYLAKALSWLGAYNVPVILLSATLPDSRRKELIEAYVGRRRAKDPQWQMKGDTGYPMITYTDDAGVRTVTPPRSSRRLKVSIERIQNKDIEPLIEDLTVDGGCIGIIVNTVPRAQELYRCLESRYGRSEVKLLHSRYTASDRALKESEVLDVLSHPRSTPSNRFIVVGTQVMEQSLDLDFDVLITDTCPIDLLLQRMGRLHRHDNARPSKMAEPVCFVIGCDEPDDGSIGVYGRYHLFNTSLLLPAEITLPDDIPRLVNKAYGGPLEEGMRFNPAYTESWTDLYRQCRDKKTKANQYQICYPTESNLMKWLEDDLKGDEDEAARATVRDIEQTLEVILVKSGTDGLAIAAGPDKGAPIPTELDDATAMALSGCRIPLPASITKGNRMEETLHELAKMQLEIPKPWTESPWLRESLFLIIDKDDSVQLKYCELKYNYCLGMTVVWK